MRKLLRTLLLTLPIVVLTPTASQGMRSASASDTVWAIRDDTGLGPCLMAEQGKVGDVPGPDAKPCPAGSVRIYEAQLVPHSEAISHYAASLPADTPLSKVVALEHALFDKAYPNAADRNTLSASPGMSPLVSCSPPAGVYGPNIYPTLGDGTELGINFEYNIRSSDCWRQASYISTWWQYGTRNQHTYNSYPGVYPRGHTNDGTAALDTTNGAYCQVIGTDGSGVGASFNKYWLNTISLTTDMIYAQGTRCGPFTTNYTADINWP